MGKGFVCFIECFLLERGFKNKYLAFDCCNVTLRYICGMKECLQCQAQFKSKSATVKFCSTKCRVKYHRKHPKPKKENISEVKLQVLYNAVLDALGKFNYAPTTAASYNGAIGNSFSADESVMFPTLPPKPKIRRSFENYQQLKLDCESIEVWEVLKEEILASDLSPKQKALLTS